MNMHKEATYRDADKLAEVTETLGDFFSYYRQYGLATLSGSLSRSARLYKQLTHAEMASWDNFSRPRNIWDTGARQTDIVSDLYSAWTREFANTWQILVMAHADLEEWSGRLAKSAVKSYSVPLA